MKQLDERILEHLDWDGWATPSILARNERITWSEGHIRERCQMLHFVGFIVPFHSEMYEFTTDGRFYLRGRIDAPHRRWPTVDKVLNG